MKWNINKFKLNIQEQRKIIRYIYFVLYFLRFFDKYWTSISFSFFNRQNKVVWLLHFSLRNILDSNIMKKGRMRGSGECGNIFGRERVYVHLMRKVNGDIKGGTWWDEIPGESMIMSMESTGAKDIRVLEEWARMPVASQEHRETVYEPVKFTILHRVRVSCENFFAVFMKKSFATEFATFTQNWIDNTCYGESVIKVSWQHSRHCPISELNKNRKETSHSDH